MCIGEIGRRGLPAAVDLLGGGAVGIAFTRSVPHNQIFCFEVEVRAAGQEQPMLLPQLWQR